MLKVLLKKQLMEMFRSFFYDAKRNKSKSKGSCIASVVGFAALMVLILGGMFFGLSSMLCINLLQVDMGWLYFLIMSGLAILMGAFGSVFNTFASLYLGKDNDLLLSMPIPPRTIVAARLLSVYLMGLMYSGSCIVPAIINYWIYTGRGLSTIQPNPVMMVVGGLVLVVLISAIVMILSCILGFCVAKISQRIKNKSFVTVLASLVFIGAYYYFYFNLNNYINDITTNALIYGEKIQGGAYFLYLFGGIGEGNWMGMIIYTAVVAILLFLTCFVLAKTFISIATATGKTEKKKYIAREAKEKSLFWAALGKECKRFTASPNYMLNAGLGVILIPVAGIAFVMKKEALINLLAELGGEGSQIISVVMIVALCFASSMINTAAPSISLEGKTFWILQTMPIKMNVVLRAKIFFQIVLSIVPMLIASTCIAVTYPLSIIEKVAIYVIPIVYIIFSATFCMLIGVKFPIMNWTNETIPIKQGAASLITIFGSWGVTGVIVGGYALIGKASPIIYYLVIIALLLGIAGIIYRYLETKGTKILEKL